MKHPEVEKLRKLDLLDAKIAKLSREMRDVPEDLAKHKDHARALKARAQQVHEEQKRLQREIDKFELEVRTNTDQAKKYLVQQNTAKTNEEYSTLKRQIEALRKASAEIEDKQLALMERIDALKTDERRALEELKEGEERLRAEEAQVGAEVAGLRKELDAVEAERLEAEKGIDMGILAIYKRLLEKGGGGRALAAVRGRFCQGCFMEIPSNNFAMLLAGKEVVPCRSCSRILFIEDAERAVTSTSYSVSEKDRDSTSKDGNW